MSTVKQTKSFTGSTSNSEWSWKQEIIEKFNDDYISTNKSIITVNSYLTRAYSNSEFGGTAECNISCRDSANTLILNKTVNKTFNWPTYVSVNNWILVQSETFEVLHNTDGTQSITVVSMLNTTDFQPNNAYILSTMQLTTIPRTSKVTCPSFNIGESTVINIERASNNFTHTLKYVFGTANGPIVAKTASISVGWTPSADTFHGQIPNATSRKGKIICETYNGNTLIGTSECEFTAYVTQDNPDVSATIVDTNQTTIALTGNSSKLIKYFSKPKVTISATPKKKATIESYKTTIADGQQSKTQTTTFPKIDTNGIVVSATDSRGWTGSQSYDATFINYIKLAFTSVEIDRTESTSTTVYFKIKGNYFNNSFGATSNTLSLKWRWRKVGGTWSDYINYTPTISGNTFTMNVSSDLVYDNNLDYQFEVVVSDKLMSNISTGIVQVTKGTGVLDIYKDKIQSNVDLILKSGTILDNIISTIPVCGENGLSSSLKDNTDVDTITKCGFYYGNNLINTPSKYGYLFVITHSFSFDYCVQIFFPASINSLYFWIRQKANDWGSWRKIVPTE